MNNEKFFAELCEINQMELRSKLEKQKKELLKKHEALRAYIDVGKELKTGIDELTNTKAMLEAEVAELRQCKQGIQREIGKWKGNSSC